MIPCQSDTLSVFFDSIFLAQSAMHSANESAGNRDVDSMITEMNVIQDGPIKNR